MKCTSRYVQRNYIKEIEGQKYLAVEFVEIVGELSDPFVWRPAESKSRWEGLIKFDSLEKLSDTNDYYYNGEPY